MKRAFYLFFCFAVVLTLVACNGGERDYLRGLRGDFQVILKGERQGVAFEATAQVRGLGDGTRELCLFYASPQALRDVTVSALLYADGRVEGGTATLRGMSVPMEEGALRGLLAPLLALLELDLPETVQGESKDRCSLTFSDERILTVAWQDGAWVPRSYAHGSLNFEIVFAK
jgi:hypothetical protein